MKMTVLECSQIEPEFLVPLKKTSSSFATPLKPRKRGLIIGASSGMGAALARRLARAGYTLALVARRKRLLDSLCAEINQADNGAHARSYIHDVQDHEVVPGLLRRIVADLGGLDAVIFAAGVNYPPGLAEYNFDGDRAMLEINLIGAFAWLNPIAAMFQSAGAGQIVAISSVAADRGRVGNPGYNTSKAGLTTYLEALRNRLSRHGVNVLTVKPGFVKTDMLQAAQRVMFPVAAETVAEDIWRAMRARKQQIYTPWFWTAIMWIIRNIPSILFRRMSF
jgi:short-subunit dehydrogenase